MTKARKFFIGFFLTVAGMGILGCMVGIIWSVIAMVSGASAILPITIAGVGTVMMISGWSIVLILNGLKWFETPPEHKSEAE